MEFGGFLVSLGLNKNKRIELKEKLLTQDLLQFSFQVLLAFSPFAVIVVGAVGNNLAYLTRMLYVHYVV